MNFWGKLNLEAFQHPKLVMGAVVGMTLTLAFVVTFLTYKKKWGWLWREWLTSLDPKKIGVMYIIVSLLMLFRGVFDAALLKFQQAISIGNNNGILTSDSFQQVFSAHGTIMIFFVAMGLMFGLINLIVPLQIGARDVAFPFLNSLSFWLFVAGMVLVNTSLAVGEFAAAGWLAYPPLSELAYSPGVGVDYWIWTLQISGLGSLLSGINFFVTIIKMRAPGMSLTKMPIFCWSVLGSMVMVLAAFPVLTATLAMLALDRTLGMHFFTSDFGGNPMMYINLIWAWGHPEVYILVLPAFGIFSEIVSTFSKKKIFSYMSMVWALMAITVLSMIVWLHHFFTMGAGANVNAFFGIMTMVIAIPTGVKVFNWLFTMYRGNINFASPMYWFMGFIATFTVGGVAGVLMAVPAIDFQVHNSLFLVAHFHNMIIGGVVFGYFAGMTYWFPKIFGFRLHEGLGKLAANLWIYGFFVTFIPIYILGIMGATRRLDHYDASLGWQSLFIVSGVGLMIILAGALVQVIQYVYSIKNRAKYIDKTGDPWGGRTLEWSTPSPVPVYNFAVVPDVSERDQFWADKQNKTIKSVEYEPIELPKNSSLGLIIAGFALAFGFGFVWHMWWLVIVGLLGAIIAFIVRSLDTQTEYKISVEQIKKLEKLSTPA